MRSTSALTRRSVYLSIQRSWISHLELGLELGQGAAVPREQQVEQEPPGRVGQGLEHPVLVTMHPAHVR